MATLRGDVRRITFRDDQNHYTVAKLSVDPPADAELVGLPALFGREPEVTVVGYFTSLVPGEWLEVDGEWVDHPEFGRQFQVSEYRKTPPVTARGIERYLGSGAIDGIGPKLAARLVAAFGDQTLHVIEKEPHRLLEVEGIGERKKQSIVESFRKEHAARESLVFLQGYGIAPGTSMKIYRQYGDETVAVVRENPYRLADDVFGIGFKTADRIAQEMGIQKDSPLRGRAALVYLLNDASAEGHVYVPKQRLFEEADKLGLSVSTCEQALQYLAETQDVVIESIDGEPVVYPSFLHFCEVAVARRILMMSSGGNHDEGHRNPVKAHPNPATGHQAFLDLTEQQRAAVYEATRPGRGLLVITGGPGTGKTTTLRAIVQSLEGARRTYVLAAPTGRAAKRVQEATGREAKTIHRLLEYAGGKGGAPRFQRNERSPIDADVVIVDEASMIDLPLMFYLLRAVKPEAKLILVGDADQLPSVGPGNVLRDILLGPTVRNIRLSEVFRQAEQSAIVLNAHRIQQGRKPQWGDKSSDFFFMSCDDPTEAAQLIVDLAARRLPNYLACDPLTDIQVLAAVRRGTLGIENLNGLLQRRLNPERAGEPSVQVGNATYRVGDRVMQTKNDYDKMVFNGDIGRIISIDPEERKVMVHFPDRDEPGPVVYETSDLHQLVLAYCTSVHKSQGSEYPVVVMPITWVMPALMNRNLLYTAITRAKKMVVLVGREDALAAYVRNAQADDRYTALSMRLGYKS